MKARKLSLALLALSFYASSAHAAATTGAIHFTGGVFEPVSASLVSDTPTAYTPIEEKRVDSVSHMQTLLHSDLLDYFVKYAAKDAKLVSVSYR